MRTVGSRFHVPRTRGAVAVGGPGDGSPLRRALALAIGVLVVGLGWGRPGGAAAAQEAWQERSGDHFVVLYRNDPAGAAAVGRTAEQLYRRIRVQLGFDRVVQGERAPLWLWDDRCRIYLHRDRTAYLREAGAPPWSAAVVDYRERRIHSFAGAPGFSTSTLPHELAHILFRDLVGHANPQVPRWLEEGVAQYAEEDGSAPSLAVMAHHAANGAYYPFSTFQGLDPRSLEPAGVPLFYSQAASLVCFLVEGYGRGRFVEFCTNLRDGYPTERALSFATGGRLDSLEALEAAWRRFLAARE